MPISDSLSEDDRYLYDRYLNLHPDDNDGKIIMLLMSLRDGHKKFGHKWLVKTCARIMQSWAKCPCCGR